MRTRHRIFRFAAIAVATVALACSPLVSTPPAYAWSTADFQPGRIIDDALFYDGAAMSASQVQAFLNEQVPRCTIGDAGRAPGSAWGNTKIASTCLRNFQMSTPTVAANAYCSTFVGSALESAASIIAKVGKACSISPKALVVMLQKEQGLVSDSWPTVLQFTSAMGYACPDTAPCDSEKGGFFEQVYGAAWQLQIYKAWPANWRYKPFQSNAIQWHPNVGCGTSNVYIENSATAGLYIYTPYRPNQSALNAGWGTGDACATYGNRNFFNYYNAWFGSTFAHPPILNGIKVIYDRAREAGFNYGVPLEERRWIAANGGGWEQRFENGVITESRQLNRTFGLPNGKFSEAYLANGGAGGPWGFLASETTGDTHVGDRKVETQTGSLIYTLSRGVQYVPAAVNDVWNANGGFKGPLKYPAAPAVQPSSSSASQLFENGSTIMTSSGSGTVATAAEVARWNALGGYSRLGYYTSNPVQVGARSYRATSSGTVFLGGTPDLFVSNGKILDSYFTSGGPAGAWGWPRGEMTPRDQGVSSVDFEAGVAVDSPMFGTNLLKKDRFGALVPRLIDIDGFKFEQEILWMSENGITSGYPVEYGAAEFRPWNTVTRDAMAAFLYRYAGEPQFEAPRVSPFVDISTDHPFYKEIAWLSQTGISSGYPSPTGGMEFRPWNTVTRDSMAAFLYRASGSPTYSAPAGSMFVDVAATHPFYKEISWLASTGVTTGWETASNAQEFRPAQSIARDAMAAFLYRHSSLPK